MSDEAFLKSYVADLIPRLNVERAALVAQQRRWRKQQVLIFIVLGLLSIAATHAIALFFPDWLAERAPNQAAALHRISPLLKYLIAMNPVASAGGKDEL